MNRTLKQFLIGFSIILIASIIAVIISEYPNIFRWILMAICVVLGSFFTGALALELYDTYKWHKEWKGKERK
jgi:hypothetical protein